MSNSKNESFTLCYTPHQFNRHWKCQSGFKSIQEADEAAFKLRESNENVITKLYPFNHLIPPYLQYGHIYYDLLSFPSIQFDTKH
jgi:hypothetical protein